MKANLWCCYQRDVPTGCIKNLRIFRAWKSVVFAHGFIYLLDVQLQLEKFFCFFLGGPARAPHNCFFLGGPARTPHEVAASCQVIYFYFYIASGRLWVIYTAGPV